MTTENEKSPAANAAAARPASDIWAKMLRLTDQAQLEATT
jgi:hypothetical protein